MSGYGWQTIDVALDWGAYAACARPDANPELWFAEDLPSIRAAKRICNRECPVKAQCLAAAKARRERWGVWGGHLFAARALRRQRVKQAREAAA